jgi:phospholipase C
MTAAAGAMSSEDQGLVNLRSKIDHIVVLMMENRSFDHMLGYLSLEGGRTDVDGLAEGMENTLADDGKKYAIHLAQGTTLLKAQDPCHAWDCVHKQLANDNAGFVQNYWDTRTPEAKAAKPRIVQPGNVMAYHNAEQLPVYDFLARNYCICDRWFCSIPAPTLPNRLYAVAGTSGGYKSGSASLFNLHTFVRHLDKAHADWCWYIHTLPPTVWVADPEYAIFHGGSIAWFQNTERWPWFHPTFLERAAQGNLPAVSWIDPHFVDVVPLGSNDDHPPTDLRAGQELVFRLYSALANSPAWDRTMLVITYDEHGGFYDHVSPATAAPPPPDERPDFRAYGPRVPAIVVSPWVEAGVVATWPDSDDKIVFDHTSLIKTILLRFCRQDDGTIPHMSARVDGANHLGHLLTAGSPRPAPDFQPLLDPLKAFRADRLDAHVALHQTGEAAAPADISDFQKELLAARESLVAGGALDRYFTSKGRQSLHGPLAPAVPGQEPPGHAPPPPPDLPH